MRGKKVDVWEGGIHVPGFANWPGKIKPKVVDDPVHIIDWFPTLAKQLNYTPGEVVDWDGVDLSGVVFEDAKLEQRSLYWVWSAKMNRWALQFDRWKIVKYGVGPPKAVDDWELYNLEEDPGETEDVSVDFASKKAELHRLFLGHRSKDKAAERQLDREKSR